MADHPIVIGVVGVCGSGKSTLKKLLEPHGYSLRHIAQEHSYVQSMWKQLVHPDILIFLDASYPETIRRRNLNWTTDEYNEQHRRLAHARQNANLYLMTDGLSPEDVLQAVLAFINSSFPA